MGAEAMSAVEADLYAPPDDATVNKAVEDYAHAVRDAYGPRVKAIYLFGSRARGDHTPESDADIAVILEDGDWKLWAETKRLTDIAYDFVAETGADLEAWPIRSAEWQDPTLHANPDLVRSIQQDGLHIHVF